MTFRFLSRAVLGVIVSFTVCTLLSYRNEMPNDGALQIGFPFHFFRQSVGYDPVLNVMDEASNFSYSYFVGDFLFAILLFFFLQLLFRKILTKKK
ncbi:hypothetical protein LZQ00_13465 [Sphingobacterium sp. SRCM116780]|uniref:hypothetical protein n=1 Tax=Sphingobacterium sp. SRCM116780 TaxID=2907623 RepID=UPI001F27F99F|nr:hypothetical protein [Sphingobacterium sp. SRCM116780]UIR55276.1 hypothetical protein LZQ00_13465 [Sphingobacterium sp. SRCM116780]